MKGYKPRLYCRKELEVSEKKIPVLEIGEIKTIKNCTCKKGFCKKNK